ncbi:MAG: hypothetical protein KGK17_01930 [Betaproteobacteria bacterium]|nr:hypothetical protein [Betaproteobacteria bacterium]
MPRGAFEFLLPDMLASLSTLGAAYPAGQVAGMEKVSQINARDMEQQLRVLQMMNEQRKLNTPKWSFHQGVAIPISPTGELGQSVALPVPPKQFPPLKPKEQLEADAIKNLTPEEKDTLGKRLLAGQEKIPQTLQALATSYIDKGTPFDTWHPQVKEWWAKQMTVTPHPVATVLNKAVRDGKASLNPAERDIFNRTMRTGTQQQKNMDYNAKRWNLALRALGKPVTDPEVQKLTPQEAQQALNKLKQDFLGGLLSGGQGGLLGTPAAKSQPKTAEDLFKMMDEEGGNDTSSE